jgi:hypothetical protein
MHALKRVPVKRDTHLRIDATVFEATRKFARANNTSITRVVEAALAKQLGFRRSTTTGNYRRINKS